MKKVGESMITLFVIGYIVLLSFVVYQHIYFKSKFMEMTGIPISLQFPGYSNFGLKSEKNYFICVSLDCSRCDQIISELLSSKLNRDDITLIFMSSEKETEEYLNRNFFNINKSINIISNYSQEILFLDVKPFAYLVNENGTIVNKKPFSKLKQINIHFDGIRNE